MGGKVRAMKSSLAAAFVIGVGAVGFDVTAVSLDPVGTVKKAVVVWVVTKADVVASVVVEGCSAEELVERVVAVFVVLTSEVLVGSSVEECCFKAAASTPADAEVVVTPVFVVDVACSAVVVVVLCSSSKSEDL